MKKIITIGIIFIFLLINFSSLSVLGFEKRIIIGDNNSQSNYFATTNIYRDHPPTLSEGIVFPEIITQRSLFIHFKVHYEDIDGDPPQFLGNYVLVIKTDPGLPYTGIYGLMPKEENSSNTDLQVTFLIHDYYRVGNYSVRFHVKYGTCSPATYVYYPPMDQDPLTFRVIERKDIHIKNQYCTILNKIMCWL